MSRLECTFPDTGSDSLDLAGYDKQAQATEGKTSDYDNDEQTKVPEGTVCMVSPTSGDDSKLFCEHGKWTQKEQQTTQTQPNQRWKRDFWSDTRDKIVCLFSSCHNDPPSNKRPIITCPAIQSKVYAGEGEKDVKVSWSPATASDPEDGSLSTRLTSSINPGNRFSEGTYSVSYEAKDSKGAVATCTVQFEVVVRRCSISHIQSSAHMESPDCYPHPDGKPPVLGTTCTYKCKPGYELVGVKTTKCGSSGAWADTKPVCRALTCPPPPNVGHGTIDCGTGPDKYNYDSKCAVNCNQGYQVQGADMIRCESTQLWSTPGSCIDKQPPILSCGGNIQKSAGPRRARVTVQWSLPQARDNSGSPVTVTSDPKPGSSFSPGYTGINVTAMDAAGNVATCRFYVHVTVKYCPPFNASSYSNVTCSDDNVYGSDCTTICDAGYELTGDTTQTCLENGTWSGQQPICHRSTCGKPDFDNTGLMIYDCPSNGYFFGESCGIRCSNGNPASGAHLITCESNLAGATGPKFVWNWKGSVVPTCQTGTCQKLRTPKNGALACSSLGSSGETCTMLCDDQYMRPRAAPDRYICLPPALTWNPDTHVQDCLFRRRPSQSIAKPEFFYTSGSCDANRTEIKDKFLRMLKGSYLWTVYCSGGGNFSCTVLDVDVTCYSTGRRRRDAMSGGATAVTIQISPQIGLGSFREQKSIIETRTFYDSLAVDLGNELQKEAGNGVFDLPEIGMFDGVQPSMVDFGCPQGTFLDQTTLSCAGCGEGHMYDTSSESCMACPVGTYQDQEIASSCIQCPNGTMTKNNRAVSAQECSDFCPPGTFSTSGSEPCDPCPKGSYQSDMGMMSCDLCPFGMSTPSTAATSKNDCQFYDVELTNETTGPRIKHFDSKPGAVTILTWVHVTSAAPRQTFTFDIDPPSAQPTSASFSLDGLQIFITPQNDHSQRSIRNWYHLAAVYNNGSVSLYLDGRDVSHTQSVTLSELWRKTIYFTGSQSLQSIVVTGLQMTSSALKKTEIQQFAISCHQKLDPETNLLKVDKPAEMANVHTTCDDKDDCSAVSCNSHGVCIEELSQFSCLCDDPWTGVTCQNALNYCLAHQCANSATCVNQYEHKNYTCLCTSPYSGLFCNETNGCAVPKLRADHQAWECEPDNVTDMQSCSIVCDKGLVLLPDIDNNFQCGVSTNYIWSHQTSDNPTGILPDCSDQRLPIIAIVDVKVNYGQMDCTNLPPLINIQTHIDKNLNRTFTCLEGQKCFYKTRMESTCGGWMGRRKRSLGNLAVTVSMNTLPTSNPHHLLNISPSDLALEIEKITIVTSMAYQLANNGDSIFNFTMQGVSFTGKFEASEWKSVCDLGTQLNENGHCVDCPAGYYAVMRGGPCAPCDVGFYQDQPAMVQCIPCRNGTTTAAVGSYSDQFCTQMSI